MLANSADAAQHGALGSEVHLPATSLYGLLDFIAKELPRWRDDPERPVSTSEAVLTEHLCDHLSSAARMSGGWDFVQFRTEVADEQCKGRKIDLVPKPCGAIIWIEGRRHTQYDSLLPIECKRLPTPTGKDRDEREYVISRHGSVGGIQRFKSGHHGAAHTLGAMIAYVQEQSATVWYERVEAWIDNLVESVETGWSAKDFMRVKRHIEADGLSILCSSHTREMGLAEIELQHLWVLMH